MRETRCDTAEDVIRGTPGYVLERDWLNVRRNRVSCNGAHANVLDDPGRSRHRYRNGPAIVQIAAAPVTREEPTTHHRAIAPDISPDDPYFRFYRYLPIRHARIVDNSVGSGFLVSPDGVILTNAHWVRDASTVSVRLADQRTFKGEVLGVDLLTDVAVIKIDAHALATVELGDSTGLAVGEPVLAIGAPDGPRVNATAGTVTAIGRSSSLVPFVRTNIAARPSGSGGPLDDQSSAAARRMPRLNGVRLPHDLVDLGCFMPRRPQGAALKT